ncbi:inactive pancreatic lipase-related protein 1-like [Liolophura sinensis]|uniref:inactive pancreatic lipase-related protein 1-like n=1 Tax=Liolophura sinensis TaxID=3198878 RepID=UPI003158250A
MTWFAFVCFLGVSHAFLLETSRVCYGELGCFEDGSPFWSTHRPLSVLPASPADIGTRFFLYTRDNPTVATEGEVFYGFPDSITNSTFNAKLPIKIIVHGYTDNAHLEWVMNMVTELLKQAPMNVITVDWEKGAAIPYTTATANTRVVGAQIAQLINYIMKLTECSSSQFHVIGHSLGAHIGGYIGERVTHLGRITGLDPAGPFFDNTHPAVRLDPSDADFVDCIHTDGSSIFSLGLGTPEPMGHVDFYPNGGFHQPGCKNSLGDKITGTAWNAITIGLLGAKKVASCSHLASFRYFTESINTHCPFKAYPCASPENFLEGKCLECHGQCSAMGYHSDKGQGRGSLYLATQGTVPYCSYHYDVKLMFAENFNGKMTVTLHGTTGDTHRITVSKNDEVLAPGKEMSHMVITPSSIGQIKSVTLSYDKTASLLTAWLYPDTIHLTVIHIYQGETQTMASFCSNGKQVMSHGETTFTAGC